MKKSYLSVAVLSLAVVIAVGFVGVVHASDDLKKRLTENLGVTSTLVSFESVPAVQDKPEWYEKKVEASTGQRSGAGGASGVNGAAGSAGMRDINYSVKSNGRLAGNFAEFSQQVSATLNDPRGWAQMNVRFVQVPVGGQFTIILSEGALIPNYSPTGCSAEWSCVVGRNVIINDDRWMGATASWNQAGGSLRDYRHMVVNHEVGHWLGHGHSSCGGPGQLAPIMQQQSMGLQGCQFNPWPLKSELVSSRL